jgi:anthranilate phosphoribosyltransferase
MQSPSLFSCATFIREIGRGARGARGLSRQDTAALYTAILTGQVSDLEMGAVLLCYRMKGEDAEELAGMLDAVHANLQGLENPVATAVSIPSYNGARKKPNLVPLLGLLLAREGVPVLIHGVTTDPGRVTTAEILAELGIDVATSLTETQERLDAENIAFTPIGVISPALASQLSLRARLGVRNSAHTLVKMLQPFKRPALRLVNYTHQAYRDTLAQYFEQSDTAGPVGVLLSRGTEGEAVADAALAREVEWFHDGARDVLIAATDKTERAEPVLPASHEASDTALWTKRVMAGELEAPASVLAQVALIKRLTLKPVLRSPIA